MFLTKYKSKKIFILVADFFSNFSFFFQCFSSVSGYIKQFLGGLHLFGEGLYFRFYLQHSVVL